MNGCLIGACLEISVTVSGEEEEASLEERTGPLVERSVSLEERAVPVKFSSLMASDMCLWCTRPEKTKLMCSLSSQF